MEQVTLSASGLPIFREDEVELMLVPRATLATPALPASNLTVQLHLTTRRLIALYPPPACKFLYSSGYR